VSQHLHYKKHLLQGVNFVPRLSNKKLAPSAEDWAHSHHIFGCDFLPVLASTQVIFVKIIITIVCLLPFKMLKIIEGLCLSSPDSYFRSRKLLRYGMHWEQCFRWLSEQSGGTVVEKYVYQMVWEVWYPFICIIYRKESLEWTISKITSQFVQFSSELGN